MLAQTFALATAVLTLAISGWLLRLALMRKGRTALNVVLLAAYAAFALAGAILFCRDLAGRWVALGMAPAALGMLEFLGILFANAVYLMPASFAPLLFPNAFGLRPLTTKKEP